MKTRSSQSLLGSPQRAFTLTEVLISMALFLLVIISVVYTQIFGLRLYTLVQTKLSSTEDARHAVQTIRDEVQSAKTVFVGNGSATSFTRMTEGVPQEGNALQIYPTTNTASFVRYYVNPTEQSLRRFVSGEAQTTVVASALTNQIAFWAEDFQGNTLTTDRNNRAIRLTLEFYQLQYPMVRIGPGYLYVYYRLQTRMTRRALE